jgi:hypothetical protein
MMGSKTHSRHALHGYSQIEIKARHSTPLVSVSTGTCNNHIIHGPLTHNDILEYVIAIRIFAAKFLHVAKFIYQCVIGANYIVGANDRSSSVLGYNVGICVDTKGTVSYICIEDINKIRGATMFFLRDKSQWNEHKQVCKLWAL